MILLIVIAAIVLVIILVAWSIYNRMVAAKNVVDEAVSGIDVQLKKRSELIPNLVEAVKGYNAHEAEVLETITAYRSDTQLKEKATYDESITNRLKRFRIAVEAYPDLQANVQFIKLMDELSSVENELAMARRYYNGTTRDFNITIQKFPAVMFAKSFGYKEQEFYTITEEEAARPDINLKEE